MTIVAFLGCCNPVGEPNGTVGFLFTKRELPIYCKTMKNKRIYLTHQHDLGPVGKIAKSWMENGKMMVAGVIHADSLPAKIAGKGVTSGLLKGLSLGTIHGVLKNNSGKCTNILWREIVDCSVCEEGDLPDTQILTFAAKQAVQEVIKNIKSSTPNFSPYNFFYSDAVDKELLDMRTKERTLNSELSIPAVNQANNSEHKQQQQQKQESFMMSTESSSQSSSGMHSQGNFGEKRAREMPPPPNIPAGLRNAALPPSMAQQSMIDPRTQANNEALRQQQQQQQQGLSGQPPAKKARTELPPAGSEDAGKSKEEAEEKQEPVPLDRKEYVDLLKAKAEKEDLAKKMIAMQAENKALKEKNQGWQTAAALSLGNNADSASLREQYNLANEERAKAAQIKVKEALKQGEEIKKLLLTAGKTPSPGTEDGLRRLKEYNKNPRQLLHKKCREDVMSLTGWLSDYNQARMLTVASGSKATAQLEAQLQTTQARYKDLEEQRELKNIGNGAPQLSNIANNSSGSRFNNTGLPMHQQYQQQPPKIPVPTQQQQQPPRQQRQQFQDYPPQDCWANAQTFQQQQQVMTTASGGAPGNAQQRYSSFYSKSSIPMATNDPGPPLRRPPSNIKMNFTPFNTFYEAPVSDKTKQYGSRLNQQLSLGTGQGRFAVPAFCGKDYGATSTDLPTKWRSDDQYTFGQGRLYAS